MQKVQITLTPQEYHFLSANALGLDVAKYVKFLASKAASDMIDNIPTFKMSKRLEKVTAEGLEEYRQGKTKLLYKI